jgi:hypothetical protein
MKPKEVFDIFGDCVAIDENEDVSSCGFGTFVPTFGDCLLAIFLYG